MIWFVMSCSGEPEPAVEPPIFLRDAVYEDGQVVPLEWQPGDLRNGAVAPQRAECIPLFSVELGDVSTLVAMDAPHPDTAMAFSPEGRRLVIGGFHGELKVVDAWTGDVLFEKKLAETMIKFVGWSPDGNMLYAAEQSPDGNFYAFDSQGTNRWTLRMADHVETSTPDADNLYGVYDLPAAFGFSVLDDGRILVSAAHGWNTDEGRKNRSKMLLVSTRGEVLASYPAEGAADAIFKHPRTDGQHVVVSVTRSAAGPAPADLPIGGIAVLDLDSLAQVGSVSLPILEPWYTKAFVWEALDVRGDELVVGFGDGRVLLADLTGQVTSRIDLGTPILSGEVPIAASVGYAAFASGHLVTQTSRTAIPWGAASPELRPPSSHPNENGVWVYSGDEVAWSWAGEHELTGFDILGDTLVVGAGSRATDERRDLYGALVFDLAGEGSGEDRLRAVCPTEGPAFFRQDQTADGRIALTEFPFRSGEGQQSGAYRVTVMR
ncbi:MAG: WD40 repeat domain-containing protein [Proteobacteria bacterium]|nr:WD40 repeat domain-containing protein [Pseudomonadota bacterium]MCP4916353.1 WD40 repeat domain-containing protein [Pseudomonadota bacterium]